MIKYLVKGINKIFHKVGNLKIRYQLIFSFVPISLLSLLVFALISYYVSTKTLNNNSIAFASQTIKLINRDISKKLNDYENISSSMVQNFNLYYLLSGEMTELESYTMYNSVKQRLNDIIRNYEGIRSIIIYPSRKTLTIKSNDTINFDDLNYKETEIYKKVEVDSKNKYWMTKAIGDFKKSNSNYLYLFRSLPTISGSNGVMQFQINEDVICNIYKDISFGKGSAVFLVDEYGRMVSHSDRSKVGKNVETSIFYGLDKDSGSFRAKLESKDNMVVYSTIGNTPWRIVATIPMDFIQAPNNRLLGISFLLIILTFILFTLVATLISSGIAKPLEKIGRSMEKTEKGNFNVALQYSGTNEIGVISQKYNSMVNEISNLLEVIKKDEKQKKDSYIKVLQAQIKPHFLYNTLFTVKCLASINKQKEIEELLGSLINLLMGSINKGGEFAKVSEDIEYIKSYVLIQAYKYKDKFKIYYEVEESIQRYYILKFLLQPLVENAILHGIENECKDFEIRIIGKVVGDALVFKVKDNGKGMDKNAIAAIFHTERTEYKNVFSGIGVRNVEERIKLHFGDSYGLSYNNIVTPGTEAFLCLPLIKDEEELKKYA